jgi:manganese/zinc/iron transport system substrate-binding protein
MRKFQLAIVAILMLLTIGSCSQQARGHAELLRSWMVPNGKLKVLSTIAMIDDLVKQIGGEYVDSLTLIKGELDPHSYQLVKGDDEKLAFADVIFYNGLGLEHGPSLQQYLQRTAKAMGLGNFLQKEDPSLVLHYKGQFDPHIWMDVSLWAKTIPYIVQALSQKDPSHAEVYRLNGEKLQKDMLNLHKEIQQEMLEIPESRRYLVTSHDAFNYFTRAYLASPEETAQEAWQKRFAAPEGLAPESQLSATDIQEIIDYLKKYQIHVLFPESNVSKDSIRKIVQGAKEKGLDVQIATIYLYADAMGHPGSSGDTYKKMIQHNAKTIAKYLKGDY